MHLHYDWGWVKRQAARTAAVWNRSTASAPPDGMRFSLGQQKEREAAYDAALSSLEEELAAAPVCQADRAAMRERVVEAFGLFSARALDLEQEAIDVLTREFLPVGTTLAQWARWFDPDLCMPDIIQACRNAWTACGLQPLLGERIRITPAILGYSLLYPYSDNYLDEELVSISSKLDFSRRFRQRLQGAALPARDQREKALWSLIELIEKQFTRERFPQVYNCLLSIHRAQEQSVSQLRERGTYSESDTLRLSCEKGGSSVLADACLARGTMNQQEARFAFEWGVLLQLGDDLQDVREDLRRGSMTLFSHAAANGEMLDTRTVQLLSFAEHVGRRMDALPHGTATLKSLLKMSWRSLIIRAVADSEEFFSPTFVNEAQKRSPFRFEFLRNRQERIASQHGLYSRLFDAFLEPDTAGPGSSAGRDLPAPQGREDWPFEAHIDSIRVPAVLE